MENKKSTKRTLLSSVLSLVLCMAMLIGTTFAWFTDSVQSNNNIIKSGNLDVELEYSTDMTTWTPVTSTTNVFKADAQWEPGYTEVVYLRVSNKGSLALKYQLGVNIVSETEGVNKDGANFKLSDYIEYGVVDATAKYADRAAARAAVTSASKLSAAYTKEDKISANGAPHVVAMVVYMPETVGNEANHNGTQPVINLGINLYATQQTEEIDSFDNQYDKDALYSVADNLYINKETGSYVALSTAGLSAAAELASSDSSVTSVTYVTDEGEVEVPVVSSNTALDNAVKGGNDMVVLTTGDYTVDEAKNTEVTIVGNGEKTKLKIESEGEYNTDYGFDGSTVTFENVTFNVDGYLNGYARMNATYNNCIINGTYTLNGKGVFNNCTFNKTGDDYCVWTWGAPTAEFNDCTFNTSGKAILLYGGASTILKVSNCIFNDANDVADVNNKAAIEVGSDWTTDTKEIIATNCTVNGFDVTTKGENTGSTLWGNKNSLPKERLNVIIDGVDVY